MLICPVDLLDSSVPSDVMDVGDTVKRKSMVVALADLVVKAETEGGVMISGNEPMHSLEVETYVQNLNVSKY